MQLLDRYASRAFAHFLVLMVIALAVFAAAQAFARKSLGNGQQTVPITPPAPAILPPAPPAPSSALNPGYLQLAGRCTYLPETVTVEKRRGLMDALMRGKDDITPRQQITRGLSDCLDRTEESIRRSKTIWENSPTGLRPYLDDLAVRRTAAELEATKILSILDPREIAPGIVANCNIEDILEKGGDDFDAETYVAGQSGANDKVLASNYAVIVGNRCYGPIMRLMDALPASAATRDATATLRQGILTIKPRVDAWFKIKK